MELLSSEKCGQRKVDISGRIWKCDNPPHIYAPNNHGFKVSYPEEPVYDAVLWVCRICRITCSDKAAHKERFHSQERTHVYM